VKPLAEKLRKASGLGSLAPIPILLGIYERAVYPESVDRRWSLVQPAFCHQQQ
jgi:hypothetical protein